MHRTQWLGCRLDGCRWPDPLSDQALFALSEPVPAKDLPERGSSRPRLFRGHRSSLRACAYSPDGHRLASAGNDGTLRLWDGVSGAPLAVFEGHGDWVRACAWSPDGRRLASGAGDGTLRLWDVATGGVLLTIAQLPDGEWAVIEGAEGEWRHVSEGAWRWLGWLAPGPDGVVTRYPAEIFGELPVWRRPIPGARRG